MISISFTEPDELYIWGSTKDLKDIALSLTKVGGVGGNEFEIKAEIVDSTPYDRSLELISVKVTEGPVKVGVINNEARVTGSQEALSTFSSFFEFEETARKGDHTHHEYFSGNEYIHPNSIPTVIGVV